MIESRLLGGRPNDKTTSYLTGFMTYYGHMTEATTRWNTTYTRICRRTYYANRNITLATYYDGQTWLSRTTTFAEEYGRVTSRMTSRTTTYA